MKEVKENVSDPIKYILYIYPNIFLIRITIRPSVRVYRDVLGNYKKLELYIKILQFLHNESLLSHIFRILLKCKCVFIYNTFMDAKNLLLGLQSYDQYQFHR